MYLLSLPPLLILLPSTLAAVSTVTVTTAAPVSTSSSYENDADFQSEILAATNFYRMEQGVGAVTWNQSMATYAQKWSDACVFKHSVCIFSPWLLRGLELGCCLSPIPQLALPDLGMAISNTHTNLLVCRADLRARILQLGMPTPVPASTLGVSSERSTIGINLVSVKLQDISRSWFGAILPLLAVDELHVQERTVSAPPSAMIIYTVD
jgi:hypothetical protein